MTEYREEDYLMLSGIQHFAFCRRQWALIHIEQQWQENFLTVSGNIMHEKAHQTDIREKRKDMIITRGMSICSRTLGISGNCDVVEFHKDENGIPIQNYEGLYQPVPVEYKKGRPKEHDADVLQLCAQAMCLEEMLACEVSKGYLYYGETKRRLEILFDKELRERVTKAFAEMHELYKRSHTPKVRTSKSCKACSLAELCLPKLNKNLSVGDYIHKYITEDDKCEN